MPQFIAIYEFFQLSAKIQEGEAGHGMGIRICEYLQIGAIRRIKDHSAIRVSVLPAAQLLIFRQDAEA